jgi:DNA-binding transcriptional LysR family regulator
MKPISRHSVPGIDPARFDLNLLRVFDTLLKERSVSGASLRLGLSQPATSAALARIREGLRDPVLVRHGNRMMPTPLAEELHSRVARILEDVDDALGLVAKFDAATTKRRFRIGANDYASAALLAPLAQRLQLSAPHATLEVVSCDTAPELSLAARETDVVIADRWSARGIPKVERLFSESFVSIARSDHPRLSRRPTLAEFLAAGHALISTRGVTPGVVDAALEKLGHTRSIVLTLPHYLVAPSVVAGTDLVMTLPRRVVERFGPVKGLRLFAPPFTVAGFDVVMACAARSEADAAIRWLMQLVRSTAGDERETTASARQRRPRR